MCPRTGPASSSEDFGAEALRLGAGASAGALAPDVEGVAVDSRAACFALLCGKLHSQMTIGWSDYLMSLSLFALLRRVSRGSSFRELYVHLQQFGLRDRCNVRLVSAMNDAGSVHCLSRWTGVRTALRYATEGMSVTPACSTERIMTPGFVSTYNRVPGSMPRA